MYFILRHYSLVECVTTRLRNSEQSNTIAIDTGKVLGEIMNRNWLFIGITLFAAGCFQEATAPVLPPNSEVTFDLSHILPPPESGKLPGHTWQAGGVTFSFQRGYNVLVRGGRLVDSMPTGAPGMYTLDGQRLSLEVLGREYTGIWDGIELTLNGRVATYLGSTGTIYPDNVLEYLEETEEDISNADETI